MLHFAIFRKIGEQTQEVHLTLEQGYGFELAEGLGIPEASSFFLSLNKQSCELKVNEVTCKGKAKVVTSYFDRPSSEFEAWTNFSFDGVAKLNVAGIHIVALDGPSGLPGRSASALHVFGSLAQCNSFGSFRVGQK